VERIEVKYWEMFGNKGECRDEELTKASGIDGGVFVHVSGFIGIQVLDKVVYEKVEIKLMKVLWKWLKNHCNKLEIKINKISSTFFFSYFTTISLIFFYYIYIKDIQILFLQL
jgi:hypothetical protein